MVDAPADLRSDDSTPSTAAPGVARRRTRVSRWDRPKPPHDWRWVVDHLGRALITVGLLIFGFVAYQLWGTGIQTDRAQHQLANEFKAALSARGITPDTIGPAVATSSTAPTTSTVASTVDTATAGTTTPDTGTPDAAATAGSTPDTLDPNRQILGDVQPGDALGEIIIDKIHIDFYFIAGVGPDQLAKGVGHFPDTPLPGEYGNAVLAGHRTTHAHPFYDLDKLQPGDTIEIHTITGGAYLYTVTDSVTVKPSDYQVVTDSDPTKATLTLITCTPIFTSHMRLVVHATLDASRSSTVGAGQIYYGEGDPSAAGANGSVLPGDDDGAAPSVSAAVGTPTTTSSNTAVSPADRFADNAFNVGWFDDTAAIPQVLLWAALFGLVWSGSYRLAKRLRKGWVGILVGVAPFVVVLYFLYENVNRLLPAAI